MLQTILGFVVQWLPWIASLSVLVYVFLKTYTVVDPNEAHVVTRLSFGRFLFAPKLTLKKPKKAAPHELPATDPVIAQRIRRMMGPAKEHEPVPSYRKDDGQVPREVVPKKPEEVKDDLPVDQKPPEPIQKTDKTSYFFFPFLMKRIIIPLTNVKIDINDIRLNDQNIAPFIADVIAWIRVYDPTKAAERLSFHQDADSLGAAFGDELRNIVQAVARAVSMSQDVLGIMSDRERFSYFVSKAVDDVLDDWGIELVDLEVNDIRDAEGSTIIKDMESIRVAQISSVSRIEIADRNREAVEKEQDNRQKEEVAKAISEETFMKRQAEKDKNVGVAKQEQEMEVARKEEEANKQKVEALRTLDVGNAQVAKEAAIETATGEGEAIRIKGEKAANVVQLTGEAEGKAIAAKGTAEATAKEKMAKAMQKFDTAATNIEKIRAAIEIQKAAYEAIGKVAEKAELKIVTSGQGANIFGIPLNAESGADLGQFLEAMGGSDELLKKLKGIVGIAPDASKGGEK